MRRTMLSGLLVASLLVPVASFAKPKADASDSPGSSFGGPQQWGGQLSSGHLPSISAGMTPAVDTGHVTGPGHTPIDTQSTGPLNDLQPGAPANSDPPEAARPKPVR